MSRKTESSFHAKQMALCGMTAAVSLLLMLLTAVFPVMSYGLPALCGVLTTMIVIECGDKMALTMYGAVSILSLLLLPSKESAVVYLLLFGWYPVAKRRIEMLRRPVLEWVIKMISMIVPVGIGSAAAVAVLGFEGFFGADMTGWMIPLFYLAVAAAFVIYDIALTRLISAYLSYIRPKFLSKLLK